MAGLRKDAVRNTRPRSASIFNRHACRQATISTLSLDLGADQRHILLIGDREALVKPPN
jgi:hypothetical protein